MLKISEKRVDDGQVKGKKRSRETLEEEEVEAKPAKESKLSKKKKVSTEAAPEQPASRVYVSGVPRDCPESSIRDKFAKYGTVVDINLPPDRRNKSLRIAFVGFAEPDAAEAALAEDGDLQDSKITVRMARTKEDAPTKEHVPPEASSGKAKIFVTGFGKDADAVDALKQHLSKKCGSIASLSVPSSKSTKSKGAARGFAIVEFDESKSAGKAMKLNGTKLDGNTLVVKKYSKSAADEKQIQKQAQQKKQQAEKEKAKREFRVVVKGFPKTTTRTELEEHFGSCGQIRMVTLPQKGGSTKGIAFVSFASEAALKAALKLDAQEFKDSRTLKVWRAVEKATKTGAKQLDGE